MLRSAAWVELHAWLASSPASATDDVAIAGAARDYAVVLATDDGDAQLRRTSRALESCEHERCARAAVAGTPFALPYAAALPTFLARHWTERAGAARTGVELARAAIGPEVEPLVTKLAQDLALEWPTPRPVVSVVGDTPEPGRDAPVRLLLSARSSCFARSRAEPDRVHDARIVDCVLAYALRSLGSRSALAAALGRELAARGMGTEEELDSAWTALVVHAVAVTVSAWEPKHASVLRRSAAAAMPDAMTWLAREWPARMRGGSASDLAKGYAAALADARPHVARPTP